MPRPPALVRPLKRTTVRCIVHAVYPIPETDSVRIELGPEQDDPWIQEPASLGVQAGDVVVVNIPGIVEHYPARRCRICGCTDFDCSGCIEQTGEPCSWIEDDLCSACNPTE